MGKNAGRPPREGDPERWEKIAMACADRDEKYEKAGVRIIRNTLGWYPNEIINFNAPYGGPEFSSIYAQAKWHLAGDAVIVGQSTGAVRAAEASSRAALVHLILESEGSNIAPFLNIETNPNSAHGKAGFGFDDFRQMGDRTIMWSFGSPSAENIPDAIKTGKYCPAGWPRGRDLHTRLMRELGFKEETWWFDSRIAYHQDCIMMNLVEGIIGLPDDGKNGVWGELPDCIKDWEIIPIPLEDIANGAANSPCIGDGRFIMDNRCTKTFELMEKHGLEPVPVDYAACWDAFNSGMDCSDSEIWREDKPPPEALDVLEESQGVRA